ncbi:MAG: 50S ribosomal protein L21 [Bacteroidota bacterium]
MYAIVDIAGQQFKVEQDQEIFVHRLEGKEESKVNFDKILLIDNNGKISVGNPVVIGAIVSARIVEHIKADKVIVFKKRRRKGYKTRNGHRQLLTKIQIEKIEEKAAAKIAPVEKETVKPEAKIKSPAKDTEGKSVAIEASTKKTVKKSATAKKTSVKKATKKEE